MADDATEQLLFKFGLDLAPLKQAAGAIKATLDELNAVSASTLAKMKASGASTAIQAQTAKATAQEALAAAKASIAQENLKLAALRAQSAELQTQITQQRVYTETAKASTAAEVAKKAVISAETADIQKQIAERRAETAEIQKQTAELRKKRLEEGGGGGGEHGEGGTGWISGARRSIGKALFGGGIGGAVATGVLAGAGVGIIAENLVEGISEFIEKLKEAVVESGRLAQIQAEYDRLTRQAGVDGTEMLRKMQEGTEGLVGKFQLLKLASTALKSPFGIKPDELIQAVTATEKLSDVYSSVDRGINALSRSMATGRTQALAMATGLTQSELKLKGLSPILTQTAKSGMELHHVIDLITQKAKEMALIPNTVEDVETQLKKLSGDLFESFGQGLQESTGMQELLNTISAMVIELHTGEDSARAFGRALGDQMPYVISIARELLSVLNQVGDIVDNLIPNFGILFGTVEKWEINLTKLIIYIGTGLQLALQSASLLALALKTSADALQATLTGNLEDFKKVEAEYARLKKAWATGASDIVDDARDKLHALQQDLERLKNKAPEDPRKKSEPTDEDTAAMLAKRLQLEEQYQEALIKLHESGAKYLLEIDKNLWAQQKKASEDAYKTGGISQEEYLGIQRLEARREYNQKIRDLDLQQLTEQQESANKQNLIQQELTNGLKRPDDAAQELKIERAKALAESNNMDTQRLQAKGAYVAKMGQLEDQELANETALRKAGIQNALAEEEDRIKRVQKLAEDQFKEGGLSPQDYLTARIEAIRQTTSVQLAAQQELYNQTKEISASAAETLRGQMSQTVRKAQADMQSLQQSVDQITQEYIKKQYEPKQQSYEQQIQFQQGLSPTDRAKALVPTAELIEQLNKSLVEQRSMLQESLQYAQPYSQQWFTIQDQIFKTYQTQIKYNEELRSMRDLMPSIASGFGAVGKGIQETFHSKFAQNLASEIEAGASSIAKSSQLGLRIKGSKDPVLNELQQRAAEIFNPAKQASTDLQTSLAALNTPLSRLMDSFTNLSNYLDKMMGNVSPAFGAPVAEGTYSMGGIENQTPPGGVFTASGKSKSPGNPADKQAAAVAKFTDQLMAGVEAITSFVTALTSAKSAISGGIGGATAGLGVGNTLDQVFSKLGPWGAVAGAGVGAVAGIITGHKNAQVTQQIHQLEVDYKGIMNQFALNTNNLNATIQQLFQLVAQAQAMQSNSKKGSSQFQQLIDQYNQQIMQLQQQQHQTVVQMNEQLAVLMAPQGSDQYLSNLQQILDQYDKFAGAAQNATDLANANNFLALSMRNYTADLSNQLTQDNQQAVQDALNLNDLIYQRTQFVLQLNNQIQGVLSQGVLTRQQTMAQSKGYQVEQIQLQAARQLDQMNLEIQTTQAKVAAEGQIFSLATTRIGLETQLLQLQGQQTQYDMLRISALKSIVDSFASGQLSPAVLALINATPGVSNPAAGANIDLTAILEQIVAAAYQDRATSGFAAFRGQNL